MYISHKNNIIQNVHELEWRCRRDTKGLNSSEYWTWIETITDSDGVIDSVSYTHQTLPTNREV